MCCRGTVEEILNFCISSCASEKSRRVAVQLLLLFHLTRRCSFVWDFGQDMGCESPSVAS